MVRSSVALLIILLFSGLLPSPALSPPIGVKSADKILADQVFADLIADFSLYTNLLQATYVTNEYTVAVHTDDPTAAVAYLQQGFGLELAQAIADCYLQWLPEHNKMKIVPTDSMPVITATDKPYLEMQRLSPHELIIKRSYADCYEVGDRYIYIITMETHSKRWIVTNLELEKEP